MFTLMSSSKSVLAIFTAYFLLRDVDPVIVNNLLLLVEIFLWFLSRPPTKKRLKR